MHSRRVVISGLGAVSGFGVGAEALWDGLCAGDRAIRPIASFDASAFGCPFASEARDLDPKNHVPKSYRKSIKVMARDSELAVVCADLAVASAGLTTRATDDAEPTYPPGRQGCHIGAGLIAADSAELAGAFVNALDEDGRFSTRIWGESGMNRLQPLWMLKYLPNMLACHVSIVHGCEGPSNTVTCSESSGLLSIGESVRVIQRNDADVCFAGGAESKITPMGLMRTQMARRLPEVRTLEEAVAATLPYREGSGGHVVGEGGGICILEHADGAAARGVTPWAEVAGFGAGQSLIAYTAVVRGRLPAMPEADSGMVRAINAALRDAGVTPDQIDAIVPHAMGVASIDRAEAGALRQVFGDRLGSIPLVTMTPAVGECFAGRGGLQVAAGAMCLKHQRLPARLGGDSTLPGLDAGPAAARDANLDLVLVCATSAAGSNAAVVLRRAS